MLRSITLLILLESADAVSKLGGILKEHKFTSCVTISILLGLSEYMRDHSGSSCAPFTLESSSSIAITRSATVAGGCASH